MTDQNARLDSELIVKQSVYTMVDKNTVQCEFSGDSDNISIYKRQYITN